MRQKYLWGGAAMVVLGAAAALVAVDYAISNPTSLLARYAITTVFAGLNPNPLSDVSSSGVAAEPEEQAPTVPVPANNSDSPFTNNPAEETIEPIQVETLPPPTAEPPMILEEEFQDGHLTMELLPRPMPYADEDLDDSTPCDKDCKGKACRGYWLNLLSGVHFIGELIGQQPDQAGDAKKPAEPCTGESSDEPGQGCLGWIEFSTPELIPVMPCDKLQAKIDELLDEATQLMSECKYEEALVLFLKIQGLDANNKKANAGITKCRIKLKAKCHDKAGSCGGCCTPMGGCPLPYNVQDFCPRDAGRLALGIGILY